MSALVETAGARKRSFEEMESPPPPQSLQRRVASWLGSTFGLFSHTQDTPDSTGAAGTDAAVPETEPVASAEPVATGTPLKTPGAAKTKGAFRNRPSMISAETTVAAFQFTPEALPHERTLASPSTSRAPYKTQSVLGTLQRREDRDTGSEITRRLRSAMSSHLPGLQASSTSGLRTSFSANSGHRLNMGRRLSDMTSLVDASIDPSALVGSGHSTNMSMLQRPRVADISQSFMDVHKRKLRQLEQFRAYKLAHPDEFSAPKALREPPIEPLPSQQLQRLRAVQSQPSREIGEVFRVELYGSDLATLKPGNWLNDNVIDAYLTLATQGTNCFAFTTHFFTKLSEDGYSSVRRWAMRKKVNVWKLDKLFVPVNNNNTHWTLLVVDNMAHTIYYYDSLPRGSTPFVKQAIDILKTYMREEAKRLSIDTATIQALDAYEVGPAPHCAEQENGYDCGMFVCLNVARLAKNKQLGVDAQKYMAQFRDLVANQLVELASARSRL